MMDFGWKKKAEKLRAVLVSGGHQIAKEMPTGMLKLLTIFERVSQTGDANGIEDEMAEVRRDHPDDPMPLWEPAEIYGWSIRATMYRRDAQIWWLLQATRKTSKTPSDKDVAFLTKVLAHLGADPTRDMIIGPSSSSPDHEPLAFGWWTWMNRWPLFEIQVNKHKPRDQDKMRVVPLGSRETDGYHAIDLGGEAQPYRRTEDK